MYDFKGDWVRSPKNTIWFKYSLMNSMVQSQYAFGDAGGSALSPDGGAGKGTVRVHVGTIGGYYAVTPRFLLDGTIGMTRYVNSVRQPDFGDELRPRCAAHSRAPTVRTRARAASPTSSSAATAPSA